MNLKELQNVSEATRRRNPELFAGGALGAVERARSERNPVQPLDGRLKEQCRRKGRVLVCITLVSCRRRELDSDNLQFALKPIRDAISNALGCDDADARIKWQYAQQLTAGQEGTLLIVEQLAL